MTSALLLASVLALQASSTSVPLDVQLPAFLKALSFDRNLSVAEGALGIGIVFDPADTASASTKDRLLEIHRELTRLRVKGREVRLVPIAYESEGTLGEAGMKVLLIAPLSPARLGSVVREAASSDFLTLATDVSFVERGVAMGMEMNSGRPRFVVNLDAAVEGGASFEASFLNLCRIVEK
jgi:YfiR/HmsC-like